MITPTVSDAASFRRRENSQPKSPGRCMRSPVYAPRPRCIARTSISDQQLTEYTRLPLAAPKILPCSTSDAATRQPMQTNGSVFSYLFSFVLGLSRVFSFSLSAALSLPHKSCSFSRWIVSFFVDIPMITLSKHRKKGETKAVLLYD